MICYFSNLVYIQQWTSVCTGLIRCQLLNPRNSWIMKHDCFDSQTLSTSRERDYQITFTLWTFLNYECESYLKQPSTPPNTKQNHRGLPHLKLRRLTIENGQWQTIPIFGELKNKIMSLTFRQCSLKRCIYFVLGVPSTTSLEIDFFPCFKMQYRVISRLSSSWIIKFVLASIL